MPRVFLPSLGSETPPICNPYSEGGEARRDALFEVLDELPAWVVELVWDYGVDRTLRAVREHPTPGRARKALEAERQRNEAVRWQHNGHLPSGF